MRLKFQISYQQVLIKKKQLSTSQNFFKDILQSVPRTCERFHGFLHHKRHNRRKLLLQINYMPRIARTSMQISCQKFNALLNLNFYKQKIYYYMRYSNPNTKYPVNNRFIKNTFMSNLFVKHYSGKGIEIVIQFPMTFIIIWRYPHHERHYKL